MDNRPRHLVIAAAAHRECPVYVIMKKENQILCVQNVLIVELFIDIKIICEMSHVC